MPKRYTPEQKLFALTRLQANFGDVTLTSLQTGIPMRTLRDWRMEYLHYAVNQPQPYSSTPDHQMLGAANTGGGNQPQTTATAESFSSTAAADGGESTDLGTSDHWQRIYDQLLNHIFTILSDLTDDPDTLAIRAAVITRLIDRMLKLDQILPEKAVEQVVRIEYQYPDGSIHSIAPWASRPEQDD